MFFSIPNLSAAVVRQVQEPWTLPTLDYDQFSDKQAFRDYCQHHATKHAFLSMVEGVSPDVRVSESEGNAPFKCWGFIVDYDGKLPQDPEKFVVDNAKHEFLPTHLVRTFSGHSRAVWQFEREVPLLNKSHYRHLMAVISRAMKLNMWMPGGIEPKTLSDAGHYYELGTWSPVRPDSRIRKAMLERWNVEALLKMSAAERGGSGGLVDIPLSKVYEEVERRWPGKWRGQDFIEGSRGAPFWSTTAHESDTASAVVFKDGMYCFSDTAGQGFFPWRRVLGAQWIEAFEADKLEVIVASTVWDGRQFWKRSDENQWYTKARSDFTQELKFMGFDSKIPKGGTYSRVDEVEVAIKRSRCVIAAAPFMFCPEGMRVYKGQRYLNTSAIQVVQPAPPCFDTDPQWAQGRKSFPFIYKLMTSMFYDSDDSNKVSNDDTGRIQLERLLAWIQYAYVHALDQNPQPGQAIVLAGPAAKGKTLFATAVLSGLFSGTLDGSGHTDGAEYFCSGVRFTARFAKSPLLLVDDEIRKGDPREAKRFTARLKRAVANNTIVFEEKYLSSVEIPWMGRIVVLCNLDYESIRMMPDMEQSVRDKICLFKASPAAMAFSTRDTHQQLIREELPVFARFLLDWKRPEHCEPKVQRFGIEAYHHPDLLNESLQTGFDGLALELVSKFMADRRSHDAERYDDKPWVGTGADLYVQLAQVPGNDALLRDIKPHALITSLGNLSHRGYGIYRSPRRDGCWTWTITPDVLEVKSRAKERAEVMAIEGQPEEKE